MQQAPPKNVGIRAMYLHFPRLTVSQAELEAADGCSGKYTIGLGQESMAFCGDREDVISLAATAVLRLLEAAGLTPAAIGKLDVGTETGVDRSKSVMSYLAEHFHAAGNTSLQGCDHMHGCYGGTAALFAVADWVSSPSWDGRLGLAVATDIAVYPEGSPARPTGGGGAAALLVGPDAPLVLEPWPWRAHFAAHTFDFFKPHGHPLYPVVDGPATTFWFTRAADECAARLHAQLQRLEQPPGQQPQGQPQPQGQGQGQQPKARGLLQHFDFFLSHAPYNKIVRKVFARLVLQDMLRAQQQQHKPPQQEQQEPAMTSNGHTQQAAADLCGSSHCSCSSSSSGDNKRQQLQAVLQQRLPPGAAGLDPDALPDSSIHDKQLERAMLAASEELYQAMASQGASLQRQLGNLYTASLYSGLAALLDQQGAALVNKRLLCFSFGSGVVASLFAIRGRETEQQQQQAGHNSSLQAMAEQMRLSERLAARLPRSSAAFDAAMASLRAAYGAAPFQPSHGPLEDLGGGLVVHLTAIDERFRRFYSCRRC